MEHINYVGILNGYQMVIESKMHDASTNEDLFWDLREQDLEIDNILNKMFMENCTTKDWQKIKRITAKALSVFDALGIKR